MHVKCLAWLMNDKKGVREVGGGEEVTHLCHSSLPPLVLPPSRHRVMFIRGHCAISPPSSLYHSVQPTAVESLTPVPSAGCSATI